jgi:hypothetical protein
MVKMATSAENKMAVSLISEGGPCCFVYYISMIAVYCGYESVRADINPLL